METVDIVGWLTAILSISGGLLIANKDIRGFYVWIVANSIWVGIDIYQEIYPQAVLFSVYTATCFYSIYRWRKQDVKIHGRSS